MLKLLERDGAWRCFVAHDCTYQIPDIADILKSIESWTDVIKDDKRSLVKSGKFLGIKVIAKQPVDKNRRKWSQFLSLLRDGEAFKTMKSLLRFKQFGISAVQPILVLEKRKAGLLKDSWLLYEYREGRPSSLQDIPEIIKQLKSLHKAGFRHDDPTLGNFMWDENNQMFLIDCKGRPRVGHFTDCFDYFLLQNNNGLEMTDVEKIIPLNKLTFGYQLASLYFYYKRLRSRWKKWLRNRK